MDDPRYDLDELERLAGDYESLMESDAMDQPEGMTDIESICMAALPHLIADLRAARERVRELEGNVIAANNSANGRGRRLDEARELLGELCGYQMLCPDELKRKALRWLANNVWRSNGA